MPYKDKEQRKAYNKGFQAGNRIIGGNTSFVQLMDRYPRLRKEFKKRVKEELKDRITTKGFDYYKYKKFDQTWFRIEEIMSEEELIKSIRRCIK